MEHRRGVLESESSQAQKPVDDDGATPSDAQPKAIVTDVEDDSEGDVSVEGAGGSSGVSMEDLERGFSEDPFVVAAAAFRNKQYPGIIEALTEAVEKGWPQ